MKPAHPKSPARKGIVKRSTPAVPAAMRAALDYIAPALRRESVTVSMSAAQKLELSIIARRYRCTEGEALLSLAMMWLETGGDGPEVKGEELVSGLLVYADAGRTPRRSCLAMDLPAELAVGRRTSDVVRLMLEAHGANAALVRSFDGEEVDFEAEDRRRERLIVEWPERKTR